MQQLEVMAPRPPANEMDVFSPRHSTISEYGKVATSFTAIDAGGHRDRMFKHGGQHG